MYFLFCLSLSLHSHETQHKQTVEEARKTAFSRLSDSGVSDSHFNSGSYGSSGYGSSFGGGSSHGGSSFGGGRWGLNENYENSCYNVSFVGYHHDCQVVIVK